MSNLKKIYDRLFDIIEEGIKYNETTRPEGFITVSKVYKDFNTDSNVQPAFYLIIDDSDPSPNLNGATKMYETTFEGHIHAHKQEGESGTLRLIELVELIKVSLAKPFNYNVNHMGMPGKVFDVWISGNPFYDDVVGDNIINSVLRITVLHSDVITDGPYKPERY